MRGDSVRKIWLGILFSCFMAVPAFAFKADPFKGAYQILSERNPQIESRNFVSIDVDRLEIMWARYAGSPFPDDFESVRNEPAILIRFTNRDTLFFTLEANAMISGTYMAIKGEDQQLEIQARPDGKFDMGVAERQSDGKNKVTIYQLGRM